MTAIADGPDEGPHAGARTAGAHRLPIEVMTRGGVSSNDDPLDVTQYGPDEMRAAVAVAANWGTYVTVHAYTPRAVQQALEAA